MKTIIVEYVNPPFPNRDFDFRATFEGYEPGDLIGYAKTSEEAKADLLMQETWWHA